MNTILSDARIAQRDASRKLYFVAAGCLYHPLAHLVEDSDPGQIVTLEQALKTALVFADLTDEEAAAFRERAIAETRVVQAEPGRFAFEQAERPPRRRRRFPDFSVLLGSRAETKRPIVALRVVAILFAIGLLACGMRLTQAAIAAMHIDASGMAGTVALTVGVGLSAGAAILFWRLLTALLP